MDLKIVRAPFDVLECAVTSEGLDSVALWEFVDDETIDAFIAKEPGSWAESSGTKIGTTIA